MPSSRQENAFFRVTPFDVFGVEVLSSLPILRKADLSRLNKIFTFLAGELSQAEDRVTVIERITTTTPAPSPVIIADTHANRIASYLASSYALGTLFWETDRTVLYQLHNIAGTLTWVYTLGTYHSILANRPADLATPGTPDDGFLFEDTTPGYTFQWDGATGTWSVVEVYTDLVTVKKVTDTAILDLRRANGTIAAPTAVLSGEVIGIVGMRGFGATVYPAAHNVKIEGVAAESHTDARGGADMVLYTTPKATIVPVERIRVTSEGLVGVDDSTPTAKMDVAGVVRSTAFSAPLDGIGTELYYTGGVGYLKAYDRAGTLWKDLYVNGLLLCLNPGAGTGNVLVKTNVDNASGGVLQVNGDASPDVDQGGSLGTALVQWDDIRFKGDLIRDADVGLTATVPLAKITALGADGVLEFKGGMAITTSYVAPT
jgi:hypothetical protein